MANNRTQFLDSAIINSRSDASVAQLNNRPKQDSCDRKAPTMFGSLAKEVKLSVTLLRLLPPRSQHPSSWHSLLRTPTPSLLYVATTVFPAESYGSRLCAMSQTWLKSLVTKHISIALPQTKLRHLLKQKQCLTVAHFQIHRIVNRKIKKNENRMFDSCSPMGISSPL